ncbi:DDE_3 domain-containing protein, partial [Trichonephila clavipes]
MRGTLTGQGYVDDILRPHIGPFLNGLPGAIFQQDNARPYTARVAQDFLRHFQTLPCPARSPDLSSVEHVWDQLKRQMPSCHSVHDLELVVQDLWAHLSQDNIRCLINSMPDRVTACIAAGEEPFYVKSGVRSSRDVKVSDRGRPGHEFEPSNTKDPSFANLDAETLSYVSDIVLSPPNSDKYHTLSQRFITQFSDSETQKIKKLLTDLQLGDEKPSHLLRKMKELYNGQLQDDFLQSLWLRRMPPHIQTVLSASSEPLDKLAIIADKVSEVVGASSTICAATTVPPPSQSSSCSAQPTMDSLFRQIQELSLQVAELTRERNSSRHQRYNSDRRRSHSRSRSVNRGSGICYYHRGYKEQARKCVSPCAFVQKN